MTSKFINFVFVFVLRGLSNWFCKICKISVISIIILEIKKKNSSFLLLSLKSPPCKKRENQKKKERNMKRWTFQLLTKTIK